jgi:hypothetical protein
MDAAAMLLTLPAHWEIWLIFGYAALVLVSTRLFEAVARAHFLRAQRAAERGFEYIAEHDHYRCPEGEHLTLHRHEPTRRLTVYRAPASRCNDCPLKAQCTPHDAGRHIYRSLAEWAETDLGRFYQLISLLLFMAGAIVSGSALLRWAGQPGTGLLLLTLVMNLLFLFWDARLMYRARSLSSTGASAEESPVTPT